MPRAWTLALSLHNHFHYITVLLAIQRLCLKVKVGKRYVDLYIAISLVPHTQGAQVWITVLPANYTIPAFKI